MSSVSSILLDEEILLESGTNELEVLVFEVADFRFGINVAKVREVLPTPRIHHLPKAHQAIRGVFELRDVVVPCVSLMAHLGVDATDDNNEGIAILTDFNLQQTAFLVDRVEKIYRLNWEDILDVPSLSALAKTPVTALAKCENRLTLMLDFEMIHDQVTSQFFRSESIPNPRGLPREKLRLILADDSPTVRQAVTTTLKTSGYTNLKVFENGRRVWDWMEAQLAQGMSVAEFGDLVISDVEMPQMDGLHLTKRIKAHPELSKLPVLLYSSIVTEDNHKKGKAVGADEQISKPELSRVVEIADALILKAHEANGDAIACVVAADEKNKSATAEIPSSTQPRPTTHSSKEQSNIAPGPSVETIAQPAEGNSRGKRSETSPAKSSQVNTVSRKTTAPLSSPESESPDGFASESEELANPWPEIESIPAVPPSVEPSLWNIFIPELASNTRLLTVTVREIDPSNPATKEVQQLMRVLHTIKSAALVLPLDPISKTTHLVESIIGLGKDRVIPWPSEALSQFIQWLRELLGADKRTSEVLAQSMPLQREITEQLAAAAN